MKNTKLVALLLVLLFAFSAVGLAEETVTLHRAYGGTGSRSFARAAVLTKGDVILAAHVEEFAYTNAAEGIITVPNGDNAEGFGAGSKEGKVLISKRMEPSYSAQMKEKAGATMTVAENIDLVQNFVVGKTVAELEEILKAADPEKPVDAISGSTATAGYNYLEAIVLAAKSTDFAVEAKVAATEGLSLQYALGAPHGSKAFGDAVVALQDGKVVMASIDEFQYTKGTGVPSSDGAFGANYAHPQKPLASKLVNNEAYSANMAEKAKATKQLAESYKIIQDFVVGKTSAEILEFAGAQEAGKPVDAVTGATLVDTVGYLTLIGQAAAQ